MSTSDTFQSETLQLYGFRTMPQPLHIGKSPISCSAQSLLSQALLPSTALETDPGHRPRTGKLHQPRQDTASNHPFLNTREGLMCILQAANTDDTLGPQGVSTRQQQALPDQFIQPGTFLLCNPKLSWHRLECNFGKTCMAGGLWLISLQELILLSEEHPAWMEKLSVTKNLLPCHTAETTRHLPS